MLVKFALALAAVIGIAVGVMLPAPHSAAKAPFAVAGDPHQT